MSLKISDKDRRTLFIFLSIVAIFLSYFFVYSPNMRDIDDINGEIKSIKSQIDVLEKMNLDRESQQARIEDFNNKVSDIVSRYPDFVSEEKMIANILELEKVSSMDIPSIGFALYESFYPEGGLGQVISSNSETDNPDDGSSSSVLIGMRNVVSITFDVTYEGLKRAIDFINQNPECMSISQISLEVSPDTGNLSGSMNIEYYYIPDEGTPYVAPEFKVYDTGVENIFGGYGS